MYDETDAQSQAVPFLSGYYELKIPAVRNGAPTWPEKFPLTKIETIRRATPTKKFSAQMLLVPVDMHTGRFDKERLKFYSSELECVERNRMLAFAIGGKKIATASAWWDPAYGSKDGDASVVAAVFIDVEGYHYLHDVEYLRHSDTPAESLNSAEEQCAKVAAFCKRNSLPALYVEGNGIGKFLPAFLKREIAKAGVATDVIETHSSRSKVLRIASAFDAIIDAGFLFVNEKVKDTPWFAEFIEWNGSSSSVDDGLDATAGALTAIPRKMPETTLRRRFQSFAGRTFKVKI